MIEDIHAISNELTDIEKSLLDAAHSYKTSAREAAIARFDYDLAWSKALLEIKAHADDAGTKVTVAEVEALTTKAVSEQMRDVRIKEAEADAARKYLSAVEAVLSSVQTRARLIQSEMNLIPRN